MSMRKAPSRIRAAARNKATTLNLSNLGLPELPANIGQLTNLELARPGPTRSDTMAWRTPATTTR